MRFISDFSRKLLAILQKIQTDYGGWEMLAKNHILLLLIKRPLMSSPITFVRPNDVNIYHSRYCFNLNLF